LLNDEELPTAIVAANSGILDLAISPQSEEVAGAQKYVVRGEVAKRMCLGDELLASVQGTEEINAEYYPTSALTEARL